MFFAAVYRLWKVSFLINDAMWGIIRKFKRVLHQRVSDVKVCKKETKDMYSNYSKLSLKKKVALHLLILVLWVIILPLAPAIRKLHETIQLRKIKMKKIKVTYSTQFNMDYDYISYSAYEGVRSNTQFYRSNCSEWERDSSVVEFTIPIGVNVQDMIYVEYSGDDVYIVRQRLEDAKGSTATHPFNNSFTPFKYVEEFCEDWVILSYMPDYRTIIKDNKGGLKVGQYTSMYVLGRNAYNVRDLEDQETYWALLKKPESRILLVLVTKKK
jgi:hypothetical protein